MLKISQAIMEERREHTHLLNLLKLFGVNLDGLTIDDGELYRLLSVQIVSLKVKAKDAEKKNKQLIRRMAAISQLEAFRVEARRLQHEKK